MRTVPIFLLVFVVTQMVAAAASLEHGPGMKLPLRGAQEPYGPQIHTRVRRDALEPTAEDDELDTEEALEVPKGYSSVHPPRKEGNVAEFNVLIFSVRDIKELEMEISLDVRLQIFWKDGRLANWSRAIEPGKEYLTLPHRALQRIWLPDIYVENLKSVNQPVLMSKPASIRIYPDALIRYSTRVTLAMACRMSFQYYPTDTQSCPVEMKSYAYDDQTLNVRWTKKNSLTVISPDRVSLPNFDFNLEENQTTLVVTRNKNLYSGIKIVVILRRKLTYHLLQTYIPSALFVGVSWLSFLVPPESVPGRMTICMTTLLTLTSMFSAVRQNAPKVNYVKAIDIWMVTCVFFVFFTLLQYTIVLKLKSKIGYTHKPHKHKSRGRANAKLDRVHDAGGGDTGRNETGSRRRLRFQSHSSGLSFGDSLSLNLSSPPPTATTTVFDYAYAPCATAPQSPTLLQEKQFTGGDNPEVDTPSVPPVLAPDPYKQAIKVLEKYAWMVMTTLFLLFNCIYWPWLIIASGYTETHNKTVYYS